ncbi:MAG TPA: penicillin-binding transpeptidase domain-containing protein, partial [Phycisphaerae bacterium]|nr:penicillin-binding transpeptidase domain-containing protein [Phycisphaerae bacterium]
ELAIDFRAMNLDDAWLKRAAIERLKKSKEWAKLTTRQARNQRTEETKANLADEINSMRDTRLAQALAPFEQIPEEQLREEILQRFSDINARIAAFRQDAWVRKFDREAARNRSTGDNTSSSGENAADVDDSNLDVQFQQLKLTDEVASHTVRANISPAAALYFKQHLDEFPGLVVRDAAEYNRRDYPFGEAFAHILGTLRSIPPEDLRANPFKLPDLLTAKDDGNLGGYLAGDRIGSNGVEYTAETALHGIRGVRLLDLSEAGNAASTQAQKRIEPVPGKQVRLTLDASLQSDLYNAIDDPSKSLVVRTTAVKDLLKGQDGNDHPAALVVMSIDGQLLSILSYPSYDPNKFDQIQGTLLRDKARTPLINRALKGEYPPGSTAKPLLSVAALSENLVTIDETINCAGHFFPNRVDIFKCDGIHGDISLIPAIEHSCDVYFYTIGQRLGINRLARWYGAYGFGSETGMELADAAGKLPKPSDEEDRNLDDARRLGIGQGPIAVTPLQMANAYATLLRGGVAIPPRIFAGSPAPQKQAFQVSRTTLGAVREGMQLVVSGSGGTARSMFQGLNLRIAGKTGTAENPRPVFDANGQPVDNPSRPLLNPDKTPRLKPDGTPAFEQLVEKHDDAWFVGYAPYDNPQYIVVAVMEWGGHGGTSAAPMVREAFLQLERHGYLPNLDAK